MLCFQTGKETCLFPTIYFQLLLQEAPDYWPGKNLLGAMLTELTCELTDDPMNEDEREDSNEEDHNEDNSEEDEDEDEYEEYEDAQQQSIDAQSQNSCPPASTSA